MSYWEAQADGKGEAMLLKARFEALKASRSSKSVSVE